jgi:hypothetical protein
MPNGISNQTPPITLKPRGENMSMKNTSLCTLLLATLAIPSLLRAAEPTLAPLRPNAPWTNEQLINERLDSIDKRLNSLAARMDSLERSWREREHEVTYSGSTPVPEGKITEQSKTQSRLEQLENETSQVNDRLEKIQRQLEGMKPSTQPAPAPEPIQVPLKGKLVVQNWSNFPRLLTVNKTVHLVPIGRSEIPVPLQPIETYLTNFESPKILGMSFWRWTGQEYEMLMEIKN